MKTNDILFSLIRRGLKLSDEKVPLSGVDWKSVCKLALDQGVHAITFDGLKPLLDSRGKEYLASGVGPGVETIMEWFSYTNMMEMEYQQHWTVATELADSFYAQGVRTFVLKGFSIGTLYPNMTHRSCGDIDLFLQYVKDGTHHTSAFEQGNQIIESLGTPVDRYYYIHSKCEYKKVTIENHQYLMAIKGSKQDKQYEKYLRSILSESPSYIGDSYLESPSPMFQALFVLSHARGHFFSEKISLRHVCDWAMVINAYKTRVDWQQWKTLCQKYDLLEFGCVMSQLTHRICGVELPFACDSNPEKENALLDDILAPENVIDGRSRFVRHYQIIRNMFQASWKFRMFSHYSSMGYIFKRVRGFLVNKEVD